MSIESLKTRAKEKWEQTQAAAEALNLKEAAELEVGLKDLRHKIADLLSRDVDVWTDDLEQYVQVNGSPNARWPSATLRVSGHVTISVRVINKDGLLRLEGSHPFTVEGGRFESYPTKTMGLGTALFIAQEKFKWLRGLEEREKQRDALRQEKRDQAAADAKDALDSRVRTAASLMAAYPPIAAMFEALLHWVENAEGFAADLEASQEMADQIQERMAQKLAQEREATNRSEQAKRELEMERLDLQYRLDDTERASRRR